MVTLRKTYYCNRCVLYHYVDEGCPKDKEVVKELIESNLERQVDGSHYVGLKIQPAEYSYKNNLSWHQGEIIKYVTRYKDKNGRTDLEKARHLIDMLIEFEYE